MRQDICRIFFIFVCASVLVISGCSPQETARILGVGVSRFKQAGKTHSTVIDKDLFSIFNKTVEIFNSMGATVYRQSVRGGYIIASNFSESYEGRCIPSTEVAVFFREVELTKTQVEVSSLNFSLSEFVAQQLFAQLQQ